MVSDMGLNYVNSLILPMRIANLVEGISFKVGESLAIHIISLKDGGQAEVSIGNQKYLASFENSVKAGESFTAVISEISEDSVTLLKANQDKLILEMGILSKNGKAVSFNQTTEGKNSNQDPGLRDTFEAEGAANRMNRNQGAGGENREANPMAREAIGGNREANTISKESAAINREPAAINREPAAASRESGAANKEPAAAGRESGTINRESNAVQREPFVVNREPNAVNRGALNSININSEKIGQGMILEVGQKVVIDIIKMQSNGEAEIRIGGQKIAANVEAKVRTGDSFPAVVREISDEGAVLVRITQDKAVLNRGIPLNDEVKSLIENFREIENKTTAAVLPADDLGKVSELTNAIITNLSEAIPQWKDIDAGSILQFFRMLGLEHENKLAEKLLNKQEHSEPELKGKIMDYLFGHRTIPPGEKAALENLLSQITGQQIWLQSGSEENAFLLMNIPCRENGEIYEARVAVEGQRKGNKIDHKHMRIGLMIDTEALGPVGADIVVYDRSLELCILHDDPELIKGLVAGLFSESMLGFSKIGIELKSIKVKNLTPNEKFGKFLIGESSGVDLFG
ncbi:hypothetical protein Sgly_2098 [Syntrophobotulus glycolicus DSM 8271]|uniref:Uncharacterized protein n=2 Tax=Syntrophobotulus TaxID=51196 RepID=F0T245_SYNGF|nr:hypothetical protein Sgly_2098 [Syntrophobotulus glycolicus DSM 8271]